VPPGSDNTRVSRCLLSYNSGPGEHHASL